MPPPLVMLLKKGIVDKEDNQSKFNLGFEYANAVGSCDREINYWEEMGELHHTTIFPTPLWHYNSTKDDDEWLKEVEKWAYSFKKEDEGREVSNVGGWQSHGYVPDGNEMWFAYLAEKLNPLPPFNYQNYWVNINKKGSYNISHTHPASDLSLVWYITDPLDSQIVFRDPCEHTRHALISSIAKATEIRPKVKRGDILIFPADLEHRVTRQEKKGNRISLSANLQLNVSWFKTVKSKASQFKDK